jgi:hypothetical protein
MKTPVTVQKHCREVKQSELAGKRRADLDIDPVEMVDAIGQCPRGQVAGPGAGAAVRRAE